MALSPLLAPIYLIIFVCLALYDTLPDLRDRVRWAWNEWWFFWYRDVYRVARYGSVHDV